MAHRHPGFEFLAQSLKLPWMEGSCGNRDRFETLCSLSAKVVALTDLGTTHYSAGRFGFSWDLGALRHSALLASRRQMPSWCGTW